MAVSYSIVTHTDFLKGQQPTGEGSEPMTCVPVWHLCITGFEVAEIKWSHRTYAATHTPTELMCFIMTSMWDNFKLGESLPPLLREWVSMLGEARESTWWSFGVFLRAPLKGRQRALESARERKKSKCIAVSGLNAPYSKNFMPALS